MEQQKKLEEEQKLEDQKKMKEESLENEEEELKEETVDTNPIVEDIYPESELSPRENTLKSNKN